METINVKDFGAKGDGITDDTAAVQASISAAQQKGGGTVYFPNGVYAVLNLQVYSHVNLLGESDATLLKKGGGEDSHIVRMIGSLTSSRTLLSTDSSMGNRNVAVKSNSGFQVGDYVVLRDNVYKYSSYGRNQELNRVAAIGTGTIMLATATIGNYAVANAAELVKIVPVSRAWMKNLTLKIDNGVAGGNYYGDYCYDVLIEDCVAIGPSDEAAFRFGNSAHCTINRCVARDGQKVKQSGYGYGFGFGASAHHCVISNCYSENIRENYFTDNTRYCSFINNVDVGCEDNMINTHAHGSEHVLISGNVSISSNQYGITIGQDELNASDKHVIVQNNRIVNSSSSAIVVNNSEDVLVSGNQVIRPCTVTTNDAINAENSKYVTITNNIVDVQASPNCAYVIRTRTSQYVTITDNTGYNGSDYGVGYSYCDHVQIQGNVFRGLASFVVRNTAGSPNTNTNISVVDNYADTTSCEILPEDVRSGNIFGGKRDGNYGMVNLGDGGKIMHGLNGTPRTVIVTGTVAGQILTVTAADDLSITLAIKTRTGSAGTKQKVYWQASL